MNTENEYHPLDRLLANLESDPDIQAALQAEEQAQASAKLESVKQQAFQRVRNALVLHSEAELPMESEAVSPSFTERHEEAVGQIIAGFKRLLSEFTAESFAAMHLGDEVATGEAAVARIIAVNECPALQEQLPWLGSTLRVYQHERASDKMTARYIAIVETSDVEANQQGGELRVMLSAGEGAASEVRLSFDYPSCEFPIPLLADESKLTVECRVVSNA